MYFINNEIAGLTGHENRKLRKGNSMAYVEGHPDKKSDSTLSKHTVFMIIASVSIIGFLLYSSDDWKRDLTSILIIAAVILALIILVSVKLNPLIWKKLLNRAEYDRLMKNENRVIDKLSELDDSYFILNDFSFELFHVEHLVVSENGIFVLAKSPVEGELRSDDGILYAGDTSLEAIVSRLWRLCHLINIVIKKGFDNLEVMPRPVLVLPDCARSSLAEFNEITIAGVDELNDIITKKIKFRVEKEKAEGFALFMKERYLK